MLQQLLVFIFLLIHALVVLTLRAHRVLVTLSSALLDHHLLRHLLGIDNLADVTPPGARAFLLSFLKC